MCIELMKVRNILMLIALPCVVAVIGYITQKTLLSKLGITLRWEEYCTGSTREEKNIFHSALISVTSKDSKKLSVLRGT